jgi:hypothetical protein
MHKKSSVIVTPVLVLSLLILTSHTAYAVNFYDGARAPKALYFLTYTSVYAAEKTMDAKGDIKKSDYGLTKVDELLRLCYYAPDFVATALVPAGYMDVRSLEQDSFGLGDINLGTGYFLPVKQVDILPMLFVKLPTGEYDSSKSVNIGSNQYDIRPMVFLYKALGDFSIDAVAKYFFRMKNRTTGFSPGDEFHLQGLLGYNLTDRFKFGPSINWMISKNKRQSGAEVNDTARETLSVGADVYYRFSKISVTATYLYDAHVENATKGHFFQIKTVYRF